MTFEIYDVNIFTTPQSTVDANVATDSTAMGVFQPPTAPQAIAGIEVGAPELFTLALVNSETDEIVADFDEIARGDFDGFTGTDITQFSIVGIVNPDHAQANSVQSVKFESEYGSQIENVEPYALFGDLSGNFRGRVFEEGSFSVKATGYSGAQAKGDVLDSVTLAYTVVDSPDFIELQRIVEESAEELRDSTAVLHRINVGGKEVIAPDGSVWAADTTANPSPFRVGGGNKIHNYNPGITVDLSDSTLPAESLNPSIFHTERWDPAGGDNMKWDFEVDSGTYEVRLYLAELYRQTSRVGGRVFDVAVEGSVPTTFDDIDVFAIAGKNRGTVLSYTATVQDGALNLEFLRGDQNPALKGIEILSVGEQTNQSPAVNEPPILEDSEASIDEGSSYTIFADDFGSDPEGLSLFFWNVTGAENGDITYLGETSGLTYTPNEGFTGTEVLTVEIWDQNDQDSRSTATLTLNVDALDEPSLTPDMAEPDLTPIALPLIPEPEPTVVTVNQAPVLEDVNASIEQGSSYTIFADDFGFDPENLNLFFWNATGAENGDISFLGETSGLTYTPDEGFTGTEVLTVEIWDQNDRDSRSTATLTLNVEALDEPLLTPDPEPEPTVVTVNQAPVLEDVNASIEQGSSYTIFADDFGFDPENLNLFFWDVTGADNGDITFLGETSGLTYTPNEAFTGTEVLTVEIWDQNDQDSRSTATLTLNVEALDESVLTPDVNGPLVIQPL